MSWRDGIIRGHIINYDKTASSIFSCVIFLTHPTYNLTNHPHPTTDNYVQCCFYCTIHNHHDSGTGLALPETSNDFHMNK